MSKRLANEQNNPFAWLDEVVEVTLNPRKTKVKELPNEQLEQIAVNAPMEARQVYNHLKAKTLIQLGKRKITLMVEQYAAAIHVLQRQAASNLKSYTKKSLAYQTGQLILAELDDLSACIYQRYRSYLPEPAPESQALPIPSLFKLILLLSGDQIGILAKAAFQAGLIPAKSLRGAFRLLAPHVSTDRYENLSGESLRSHSGRAETPDLDIVLGYLCKVTEIVRGYYRRR